MMAFRVLVLAAIISLARLTAWQNEHELAPVPWLMLGLVCVSYLYIEEELT